MNFLLWQLKVGLCCIEANKKYKIARQKKIVAWLKISIGRYLCKYEQVNKKNQIFIPLKNEINYLT